MGRDYIDFVFWENQLAKKLVYIVFNFLKTHYFQNIKKGKKEKRKKKNKELKKKKKKKKVND